MRLLVLILLSVGLVSCLKTRGELSDVELRERTAAQQRAEQVNRLEEVNEKFMVLNGRLEALDNKLSRLENSRTEESGRRTADGEILTQRLKAYDEEIQKLQNEIAELREQAKAAQTAAASTPAKAAGGKAAAKPNHYQAGETAFAQKEWQTAIVSYQKYRESNPKGKSYLEATYKIGVSFMELGMKDEARSFFEEVQQKAPKSSLGKNSSTNLKKLR